jgi:hypothetical protein
LTCSARRLLPFKRKIEPRRHEVTKTFSAGFVRNSWKIAYREGLEEREEERNAWFKNVLASTPLLDFSLFATFAVIQLEAYSGAGMRGAGVSPAFSFF